MITNCIKSDRISLTQGMVLFWGCLLSPVVESLLPLPHGISFLAPLFLLPFFLLWGIAIGDYGEGNRSFLLVTQEICGEFLGKILLWAYLLWGVLLLSQQLRLCGLGFLSVGYQEGSLYFILPALGLFVLWMSGGTLGSFARACSFYLGILLVVIILVLGFSLPQGNLTRVFPLRGGELPLLGHGFFSLFGIFGYGIYASFFYGEIQPEKNSRKTWYFWTISACLLISAYVFIAFANFGTGLLQEMPKAFFQLSKGIAVEGGFQRVESVVMAVFTLGDFILLGVLLRGAGQCGKALVKWEHSQLVMTGILLPSVLIALFWGEMVSETVIYLGNFLFAWVIPCFLIFRKKSLQMKKNCDIIRDNSSNQLS